MVKTVETSWTVRVIDGVLEDGAGAGPARANNLGMSSAYGNTLSTARCPARTSVSIGSLGKSASMKARFAMNGRHPILRSKLECGKYTYCRSRTVPAIPINCGGNLTK